MEQFDRQKPVGRNEIGDMDEKTLNFRLKKSTGVAPICLLCVSGESVVEKVSRIE